MKKDKQKVIGEELSDDRIRKLLNLEGEEGINRDYFILMRAYRALRSHDFARFITFFKEAGFDTNAKGPDGLSLQEEMKGHTQAERYLQVMT
ncbi:PA4642 family protein [Parendozoicomonas sp. Alg238-R29]|uniref:PA4642 family protein n=1 Tax=Parendozoicomonas sp. Alg238-R29 TaxID=2993446 RepID=UPI00248E6A2B|nr:PA4642 family protein [Parendozoicomonas sp. Alg238-R29]